MEDKTSELEKMCIEMDKIAFKYGYLQIENISIWGKRKKNQIGNPKFSKITYERNLNYNYNL